jgi:RimK family alpha-L-glutamate ligase
VQLPIFYAEERPSLHLLEKAAKRAGFEPFLFHFRDIEISLSAENQQLKIHGKNVRDFPFIFVREIRNYSREATLLAKFCHAAKIPIIDSALLEAREGAKIDGVLRRSFHHLSIPKTFSARHAEGVLLLMRPEGATFPVVAKENRGRQGRDVHLLKNKMELYEFFRKAVLQFSQERTLDTPTYLFQEFIPSDSDIRVLIIGGKALGAIERRSAKKNEFRHNVALGAKARQIPVTAEMKKIALAAAKVAKYEFAGVDLIRHRDTGKFYILEVNRSPEFEGFMKATGIDVPNELMKFLLRFRRKKLQ